MNNTALFRPLVRRVRVVLTGFKQCFAARGIVPAILFGLLSGVANQTQAQIAASLSHAPHSEPLHLQISDAIGRPLAMVSGDFDEDGTPDLVIGYSTAEGGSLQLLHGNPEAIAPRTEAGWLAAAHHKAIDPFVQQAEPIATKALPELLLAADVNGDGHLDLVYASRNSGAFYVMAGDGHGGFRSRQRLRVTVPGGITTLAAWRPGAPVTGDALLVSYTTDGAGKLGVLSYSAGQLGLRASYFLPAPATSITVASLDADSVPDAAIIADGELLVLHGKDALTGGGRLEVLPVDAADSVTAGEFVFDRHAQTQLAVATASGDLVILAHQGFDTTPWTPAQIATTRHHAKNRLSLAQQAGNTSDAPWVEIENHSGLLSHAKGTVLVRSRISGSRGDDVIAVSPGTSERTWLRHLDNTAPTRSNLRAQNSASSVGLGGNRAAVSSFSGLSSSGNVVAALSMRVNADARTGLVVLNDGSFSPEFTVPGSGNTFFVNTTADNTGSTTDPSDGIRCTEGSGEACTLRDAVFFANDDASDNMSAGKSDTIMVPSGTYSLTWQAGATDANTNAVTHLEILGPVTIIGSTSGGGTIINGDNNDTVFTINPGPVGSFNPSGNSYVFDMTMENLVIENGRNVNNLNNNANANYGGGCLNWDAFGAGNLTLTNITVENCTAMWGPGGGIWALNTAGGGNGTLTISGGTIANNSTPELGGGIENGFAPAALSITNTTITGNAANKSLNTNDGDADGSGGGLYLDGRQAPPATPQSTLTNVTISSNVASNDNGGGIATFTGLNITGSVFSNNSSGGSGGGIWSNTAGDGSQTTIVSSNFLSNSAAATGGAIALGLETQAEGNILQVSLSRIVGNTATGGGSGLANGVSGDGAGEAIATENWWGCNMSPTTSADGCDQAVLLNGAGNLTTAPFAKLGFTSDVTTIPSGGIMNLTVSLNTDSNNNAISGAFPAVATNYPYTFNVSGVTVSPALTTGTFNTSGVGTATLTPTSGGSGTVSVTFDNQTDSINFTSQAATATSLSISAIPSTSFLYGQPSGFTVQLTPSNATGITAANFQVTVDGATNIGGNPFGLVLIGNNNYQIFGPFNLLSAVGHTLAVSFLGTTDFAASAINVPVSVLPGTVLINDTITPTAPVQGQGGSINVTVGGIGSGVLPTGTLTYAFDGGAANNAGLSAGAAVISIPTTLSAGSHSLSITYSGDANYALASTSVPFSLTSSNYVVTTAADDESTATDCTVQNSTTTGTDSHCTLRDALLAAANAGAGNIYFDSTAFASAQTISVTGGTLTIPSNTTITGATTGSGAALQNLVTVSGGGSSNNFSVFTVNSGVTGAAIHNLIIANGYVNTQGGGIYTSGSLTVTGSTFLNNYAAGVPDGGNGGGAIYVNSGVLAVSDSTFSGNTSAPGGAMNVNDGTVTIKQSTFSGNSAVAGTAGGAIFINNGTLTIAGSTFSANSAAGGGAVFNYATLTATNTIMAGNAGGDCGAGGSNSCPANGANGNVIGVTTVAFTPLGNYGGPTQTLIPLPGSSAICAGLQANIPSGVTTDQRGLPNTNASYPGYSAGAPCVDAGAVQTNYALNFTQQPSDTESSVSMSPAPAVTLTESGNAFTGSGVTIPLTLTGTGTLSGGTATTSAGVATFSSLQVSGVGSNDTLTATLPLNPNLSTPLSLAVTSNSFNVASAVTATLQVPAVSLTEGHPASPFTPVTGSGGTGTLNYSISPGLPAGLSFNTATGAITGTPTVASSETTYTVTISDAANGTATASFSLEVSGPLKATQAIASEVLTLHQPSVAFTPVTGLGGTAPLTYSISPALPAGLSFSSSTGSITGTPTAISPAASYTVTITDTNGVTATAGFSLTVNSATLIVTANSATRVYGSANPAFTGTVTGTVNGDTFTESFSTTATVTSNVGTYPIVPSATGTNLADYSVQTTNGTLTITQAASATMLSASPTSITSGQSLTLTATVTDATPNSTGTLTGTVSFFDGSTLLGTAALSGGTASYVTSALAPGVSHTLTAGYSGDVNFTASSTGSAISVPVAALDFTLTMDGTGSQTAVPGATATYTFKVAPEYGAYPGPVTFSVAGLPPGAVAAFSPTSITANGGAQSVVLTVQTASTTAKTSQPFESKAPLAFGVLLLPLIGRRRARGGLRCLLIGGALIAGVVSTSGCGTANGFNGQAVKNYTVTVTAVSGGVQHSFDVNLNLQ